MERKTLDPAQRRSAAVRFFSSTYYQKHERFSDILTATFPPASPGAARIVAAGRCRLVFDAYGQGFDLDCGVSRLADDDPLFQVTVVHNRLFNPGLPGRIEVLAFTPDWSASKERAAGA